MGATSFKPPQSLIYKHFHWDYYASVRMTMYILCFYRTKHEEIKFISEIVGVSTEEKSKLYAQNIPKHNTQDRPGIFFPLAGKEY